MPSVPYSPTPDVSPQNITTPKLRVDTPPAAFGANIAQAIDHLGSTEGQVGNELWSRAIAMQQLRNETEATEKSAQYIQASDKLFTDFEGQKRGLNAVAGEEEHRKAQDDLRKQMRSTVSNPMAQKMFDSKTFGDFNRALFNGARHAAAENRSAVANSYQSQVQAAVDTAENARTPEEFQAKRSEVDSAARDLARESGLSGDSADQLAYKWKSAATANYLKGLARRDAPAAHDMFMEESKAGRLHGADRDRVEALIDSQLHRSAISTFVDMNEKNYRDPETYLVNHGAPRATGVDYRFGQSMLSAGTAYFKETGKEMRIVSLVRTTEEQAKIYAEHAAMPGGIEAHPAAPPGSSRHEIGKAADTDPGFAAWLRQGNNAQKYGLEFLSGKTGIRDPNHVQLSGDTSLRPLRTYDIDKRSYIDGAEAQLLARLPDAPDVLRESVRNAAIGKYDKNASMDRQRDESNAETIREALQGDNPPRSVDDLLRLGPQYQNAWDALAGTKIQTALAKQINRDFTTNQGFYHQQLGMASSEDTIPQFISPENYEGIQTTDQLSRGKKDELTKKIFALRQKAEHDPTVANAWGRIRYTLPDELQKGGPLQNQYKGALQAALAAYKAVYEKPAGPKEIDEIGQRLMGEISREYPDRVPVPHTGFSAFNLFGFGTGPSGRRFEVAPASADYDRIKKDYTEHFGVAPTDQKINQVFIAEQFKKLYGKK